MLNSKNSEMEFKRYKPDNEKLKKIIDERNAEVLNEYAKELGKGLGFELKYKEIDRGREKIKTEKELTTSQIRGILDEIQKMHKFDGNKLQLLRPKLAYAAGRHKGRVKEFQEIVEEAIKFVKDDKSFEYFKNFIEAIVAYHRYYGGE